MTKEDGVTEQAAGAAREVGIAVLVQAMLDTMIRLRLDYADALTVALTTYMYTIEATGQAMEHGFFSKDRANDVDSEQQLRRELQTVSAMLEGLSTIPLKNWSAYLVACRAKAQGTAN